MNRPLAAENTNDGRVARDTVVESLADDGMMFLAVKKTALDLIEWQTQELERLRGELAARDKMQRALKHFDDMKAGVRALTSLIDLVDGPATGAQKDALKGQVAGILRAAEEDS